MAIDTETAARVAKLARIKVEDSDLPALAGEFNAILGFIEQLNEVDVSGIEPMTSVTPMRLKRRVDAVTDGDRQDRIRANAPDFPCDAKDESKSPSARPWGQSLKFVLASLNHFQKNDGSPSQKSLARIF